MRAVQDIVASSEGILLLAFLFLLGMLLLVAKSSAGNMQFYFNFFKNQAFDMKHNKASTFAYWSAKGTILQDKALKGGLQCGKVTSY